MTKITINAVAEAAIDMAKTYPFPEALRPELARQIERVMQQRPTIIRVKVKGGKHSVKTLAAGVLNAAICEVDADLFRAVLEVMRRTEDTRAIEEAWRKALPYPGDGTLEIDLDLAIDIANKGI